MVRTVTHLLLSGIYIINGWGAFSKPGGRPKLVAAAGIPQPEQAVVLNAAVMIFAGLLLGLGITPRLAAALLLGSMIPTTLVGHPFGRKNQVHSGRIKRPSFLKILA